MKKTLAFIICLALTLCMFVPAMAKDENPLCEYINFAQINSPVQDARLDSVKVGLQDKDGKDISKMFFCSATYYYGIDSESGIWAFDRDPDYSENEYVDFGRGPYELTIDYYKLNLDEFDTFVFERDSSYRFRVEYDLTPLTTYFSKDITVEGAKVLYSNSNSLIVRKNLVFDNTNKVEALDVKITPVSDNVIKLTAPELKEGFKYCWDYRGITTYVGDPVDIVSTYGDSHPFDKDNETTVTLDAKQNCICVYMVKEDADLSEGNPFYGHFAADLHPKGFNYVVNSISDNGDIRTGKPVDVLIGDLTVNSKLFPLVNGAGFDYEWYDSYNRAGYLDYTLRSRSNPVIGSEEYLAIRFRCNTSWFNIARTYDKANFTLTCGKDVYNAEDAFVYADGPITYAITVFKVTVGAKEPTKAHTLTVTDETGSDLVCNYNKSVLPGTVVTLVFEGKDKISGYAVEAVVSGLKKDGNTITFVMPETDVKVKITSVIKYVPDDPKILVGDVNEDGKVNSKDYALLKRHCLGTYTLEGDALLAGDINGDEKVNSRDYALLKRYCLGTYEIEQN